MQFQFSLRHLVLFSPVAIMLGMLAWSLLLTFSQRNHEAYSCRILDDASGNTISVATVVGYKKSPFVNSYHHDFVLIIDDGSHDREEDLCSQCWNISRQFKKSGYVPVFWHSLEDGLTYQGDVRDGDAIFTNGGQFKIPKDIIFAMKKSKGKAVNKAWVQE